MHDGRRRARMSWEKMIRRCNCPKDPDYSRYGGRGIRVAARWLSFENFYEDMGDRPENYTIERKNTNGHYTPENCVWADYFTQNNNQTHTVKYTFEGKTLSLSQWAREKKVSYHALNKRLKRLQWTIEDALGMPIAPRRSQRAAG